MGTQLSWGPLLPRDLLSTLLEPDPPLGTAWDWGGVACAVQTSSSSLQCPFIDGQVLVRCLLRNHCWGFSVLVTGHRSPDWASGGQGSRPGGAHVPEDQPLRSLCFLPTRMVPSLPKGLAVHEYWPRAPARYESSFKPRALANSIFPENYPFFNI